ncbi:phosphate-import protein PhnD precursor [mine drainage metagenome]|uniref:Phosphate-import protein PhnD n=1 Tax=mine drainage metagenome TaxID=410659 RepID=A0A1J5SBZ2_9ZZZZ
MTTKKISFNPELLCQKINETLKVSQTFSLSLVFFLIVVTFSCNQTTKVNGPKYSDTIITQKIPVYHFAIHPLHNPNKLMSSYQPLIDYLNEKITGAKFEMEASKDYSVFEQKYRNRGIEFLLPNPWQTLQAIKSGYNVIAMAGDPNDFKGIFIVRKDCGINKPSDLIGKKVSYPAATALAACIMPQYFLYKNGININTDIENMYVGSQESSIMNVYLKQSVVGATWPPPWRLFLKEHAQEASQLKIIWETESLINNSVMARNDVPANIIGQVQKCLLQLDQYERGRKILDQIETEKFLPASNTTYDVVATYVNKFEKDVRKIDTK